MTTPPNNGERGAFFRIDDEHPDPEAFIQTALDAKIRSLDAAIAAAPDEGELGRLVGIKDRYLVRRGIAPVAARPAPSAPIKAPEPINPQESIPEGAIPQPRRFSTAKKIVETPKREAPTQTQKPASQMASFLQGIQSGSKAQEPAPKPQTAPQPAAGPSGSKGGMMSFLKNVQSRVPEPASADQSPAPANAAAPDHPAQSSPPAASPAGGGAMLSYLQKLKSGEPAQAPSAEKPKKEKIEKHGELHNELEGLFDELK